MRKFIRVCFPMHCVRKGFSIACLVHAWTSSTSTNSSHTWNITNRTLLNTSICRTNHRDCWILSLSSHAKLWTHGTFCRTTVGNSVFLILGSGLVGWSRLRKRSWCVLVDHIRQVTKIGCTHLLLTHIILSRLIGRKILMNCHTAWSWKHAYICHNILSWLRERLTSSLSSHSRCSCHITFFSALRRNSS